MKKIPFRIRWISPSGISVRRTDGIIEDLPIGETTRNLIIGVVIGILGTGILLLTGQWHKLLRQTSN